MPKLAKVLAAIAVAGYLFTAASGCEDAAVCGDDRCDLRGGESAELCPDDCYFVCGDGVCDLGRGEGIGLCVQDCGFARIVSSEINSCAVRLDGTVWCWGAFCGCEERCEATIHRSPHRVGDIENARDVATSMRHGCAVTWWGEVLCWGSNCANQLGRPVEELAASSSPVPVNLPGVATSVTVGLASSCAVLEDGTGWCWGTQYWGELGNGSATGATQGPVRITGLSGIVQISQHQYGSLACARVVDGSVWCWGTNSHGSLGSGDLIGPEDCLNPGQTEVIVAACSTVPVRVVGVSDAVWVASGESSACAILENGTVWCWGSPYEGLMYATTPHEWQQCGQIISTSCMSTPVRVDVLQDMQRMTIYQEDAGGVTAGGDVWRWGSESSDGPIQSSRPSLMHSLDEAAHVTLGSHHGCALKADGTIWCWGSNRLGQLGVGTSTDAPQCATEAGGYTCGWPVPVTDAY